MESAQRTKPGKLNDERMNKREASVLARFAKQLQQVTYDFSRDGGAVGTIDFGVSLPDNSYVTAIHTVEQTAVTGADDIDIVAGSTDLATALDLTADAGFQTRALAGSADGIAVNADDSLKLVINTNPATAGKVVILLEFVTLV